MKEYPQVSDEPGRQMFWKPTLTDLCAVVVAILALYVFRWW